MRVFGRDFELLPDEFTSELSSLERERAIYIDHWIDELDDFRHVRIAFTQEETEEYARRAWAFELFLRAGQPRWAKDVPGIDPDIAEQADSYELTLIDGTAIPPPCHCIAAFLGPQLEALTCFTPPEREVVIEQQGRESLLSTLRRAIDSLTPAIRSFNRREKGLTPWPVEREDDVRDLLYAMLRPVVSDLRREEPIPSKAGSHKFVDLCSNLSRLLVELKWIGQPGRWKKVLDEIAVDIQSYAAHPSCETLVFVVVDAVRDIPDPSLVERELSGTQEIGGRRVEVAVYIREP